VQADPSQEVGCHTFSHVVFGDKGCSVQVAEAEVVKCVAVAQEIGVNLKSLIFPRNRQGHLQVVKDFGFSCYRSPRAGWVNMFHG